MKVRVYGHRENTTSFGRVAAGAVDGLDRLGLLAGFYPLDEDTEAHHLGADADIGVLMGPPDRIRVMDSFGFHKHRLALLSPNSTWLPRALLTGMEKYITGYVTPSRWAKSILCTYTKLPVHVWQHGVSSEFRVDPRSRDNAQARAARGLSLQVLHMASSCAERKGTRELIRAWKTASAQSVVVRNARLRIMITGSPDSDICEMAHREPRIELSDRAGFTPKEAAEYLSMQNLIIQPSRGEAFGMVPLEARCCGVPALATACTGHAEHNLNNFLFVDTSDGLHPIDDGGQDAMAPAISEASLVYGIVRALESIEQFTDSAIADAPALAEHFSWKNVTARWLKEFSQ